jgi:hypothetical protein
MGMSAVDIESKPETKVSIPFAAMFRFALPSFPRSQNHGLEGYRRVGGRL